MTLIYVLLGLAAYAAIGHRVYFWSESQWRDYNDYLNWKYPSVARPYDPTKDVTFNLFSAVFWPLGAIVLLISEPQRRAERNLAKGITK